MQLVLTWLAPSILPISPRQDVCGGGVCAKSYDADLRDGDLDAGPDSCPAASALSAVLPNLVSSCVALDGSTGGRSRSIGTRASVGPATCTDDTTGGRSPSPAPA